MLDNTILRYALAVIAALLPMFILFYYIRKQDSAQPEPASKLWKGVFYGAISTVLVIMALWNVRPIEELFPQFEGQAMQGILDAFLLAAIPEECAKLFMLWLLLRKNKYFDEHLDGIVYATCVGLGFAGLENILYVTLDINNFVGIALSRACLAVPGHFFFAVAMGYFVSKMKFAKTRNEQLKNAFLALFFPILLHGIYDALLMVMSIDESLSFICTLLFGYFCYKLQKTGRKRIQMLKQQDGN